MSKSINTRLKALELLLEWAIECDFGYDNLGDTYEDYKEELEKQDLGYKEGLIWIAEQEIVKNENKINAPTVEAIPIEWIINHKKYPTNKEKAKVIEDMIDDWRKENE